MENHAAGQKCQNTEMQAAYTRHAQKSGRPAHPKQNLELALSEAINKPAQTPKRKMENHQARQNGKKLQAGLKGKSCSRA
jgi:hypothetical protein